MSNEKLIGSISEEKEKQCEAFTKDFIAFYEQLNDHKPNEKEVSIAEYGFKFGWLRFQATVGLKLNELEA